MTDQSGLNKLSTYIQNNRAMIVRYSISGLSGVFVNLLVFSVVVEIFNTWYLVAALYGFLAAYVVTFSMHKFWTFSATSVHRTFTQSLLYMFSAVSTLVVNSGLLYLQVEWFHFWPFVAQSIALCVSAVLSFIFTSQVTFHANGNRLAILSQFVMAKMQSLYTLPILLLLIALIFMAIRLSLMPIAELTDAPQYISIAQFMFNDGGDFLGHRYIKPLAPAVVGTIAVVLDGNYSLALLIQALLGYLSLIFATYWFGIELLKSRRQAVLLSLLVGTTYPILRYALTPIIEGGAWALYFASLAALLRWSNSLETRWLWITSIFLLAGVLWKEYTVLAGIVFGLTVLTHSRLSWSGKIFALLQGACLILLPWLIWQYYVYDTFSYSYLDWLAIGSSSAAYQTTYTFNAIVKSLLMIFSVAWFFVFISVFYIKTLPKSASHFLWALALPSFGFLLWGYVSSRLFFSLVPLVAPLAVVGLTFFNNYRTRVVVVICIGIVNLALVWLGYQPHIRERINTFTYGEHQLSPSEYRAKTE